MTTRRKIGRGAVTVHTLRRLPAYLNYLKTLPEDGPKHVSATSIAEALRMNDVVVRKDLAAISDSGRPRVGYERAVLIREISDFLGFSAAEGAVLVGAGKLGSALMDYEGFAACGFRIVAAFDSRVTECEYSSAGCPVYPAGRITELTEKLEVRLGIITVPVEHAQDAAEKLIRGGVRGILNFAPIHLNVPEGIFVQQEDMASSLAMLSAHLKESSYL